MATNKCYYVTYTNCAGSFGDAYLCAADLEYKPGGNCGGGYFASASLGLDANNASERAGSVTQVPCSFCPGCDCIELPPGVRHDCLNGGCIPATTYRTPGVFPDLDSCRAGCARNSPCEGECVPYAELTALQQAANRVKPRICQE